VNYHLSKVWRLVRMPTAYSNWWTAYRHRFARRTSSQQVVEYRMRGGPRMKMMVGPNDVRILNEVFLDGEYIHPSFSPTAGWRVLDIGAHKGSFTAWALSRQPDMTVACYEPNPSTFALLAQNVPARVVNAAVGSVPGRLRLYEVRGSTGQSSVSEARAASRGEISRTYDVDVVSLSDALDDIGGTADAVKIDVEGSEYDLILHAPESAWSRIGRIALEYDIVSPSGDADDADLLSRLSELGYTVDVRRRGLLFAWR
jgi:FkbM family methyltransferase